MTAQKRLLVAFFIASAIFLFFPKVIFAQVVINEVLPNPVGDDVENEWLELYNIGNERVNVIGFILEDRNGRRFAISTENTQGKEFVDRWLVIYPKGKNSFAITNTDKTQIKLYDSTGSEPPLDIFVYSGSKEGHSWSRIPDGLGGVYSEVTNPTPNSENQLPVSTPTPTLTPTPTPTSIPPTPTSIPTSPLAIKDYSNIFISEFMAYPENGNEWAELYNDNNFEVDLYGWYIDDIAGTGSSSPRSISGTISAKTYKQFSLNSSAYLNNSGDDVRLLNGEQVEKDKVSFETSTKGKSWAKDKNDNWCQIEPTPNAANPDCPSVEENLSPTPTSTTTPTPTPKPTPTPTLKTTPTVATESGEILGEEEEATTAFYLLEATAGAEAEKEATPSGKKSWLAKVFLVLGLIILFGTAFSIWYNFLKDGGTDRTN